MKQTTNTHGNGNIITRNVTITNKGQLFMGLSIAFLYGIFLSIGLLQGSIRCVYSLFNYDANFMLSYNAILWISIAIAVIHIMFILPATIAIKDSVYFNKF